MLQKIIAAALLLCLLMTGCANREEPRGTEPQTPPEDTPSPAQQTPEEPKETEPQAPQTEQQPEPAAPEQPQEQPPAAPQDPIITTYSTPIMDHSEGRLTNLQLSIDAVNGVQIDVGGVFSFNDTVGKRTAEKGYQKAIVFKDKEKVMEIGGGICQLSTTIYDAALQAGFEIVERHAHQLEVDYAEEGMDATVSYGGKDFKFKNNSDTPIVIECSMNDKEVIVVLKRAA